MVHIKKIQEELVIKKIIGRSGRTIFIVENFPGLYAEMTIEDMEAMIKSLSLAIKKEKKRIN